MAVWEFNDSLSTLKEEKKQGLVIVNTRTFAFIGQLGLSLKLLAFARKSGFDLAENFSSRQKAMRSQNLYGSTAVQH